MGSVAGKDQPYIREDLHAGSWYESSGKALDDTLEGFLRKAAAATAATSNGTSNGTATTNGDDHHSSSSSLQNPAEQTPTTVTTRKQHLRGLIVPHAGYAYSGPTAAYAYYALQQELAQTAARSSSLPRIRRILVLHPSHHVYLEGCAVSGASSLNTPVGALRVDDELRHDILALARHHNNCYFSTMTKRHDEEEHSGEMQYPYLAKILYDLRLQDAVTVLPVMCGSLSTRQEQAHGRALAKIIARPDVLTVVSTDFCHWGDRFSYRPQPPHRNSKNNSMPLHEFIQQMDRRGMDLIELQEPFAFAKYLQETKNTICGRHAIAVWMHAVAAMDHAKKKDLQVQFVKYAQSSAVQSLRDSSVSYAAAVAVHNNGNDDDDDDV